MNIPCAHVCESNMLYIIHILTLPKTNIAPENRPSHPTFSGTTTKVGGLKALIFTTSPTGTPKAIQRSLASCSGEAATGTLASAPGGDATGAWDTSSERIWPGNMGNIFSIFDDNLKYPEVNSRWSLRGCWKTSCPTSKTKN